ncbi:MAG: hypothetical protein GXO35_02255 [Gammaproteobacteria bacterium]|nr:hypothetical protein [Gammaproteobacteria bacterium]
MDNILKSHNKALLETTFESDYLYDHPLYSLMAERTELAWLLIIPKKSLIEADYIGSLYSEIYRLIFELQKQGFGPHFNLAKIGNKNPNQHIHLIFRAEEDEVWPDAVWCHEPLNASEITPQKLKSALKGFFSP